jgi:uncharacterized phage protein gp47/JayE
MPWTTPTLSAVRVLSRDYVSAALNGAALVGNSVLRVMSDCMGGLAHLTLQYIDWLANQLLPDTAEQEWLDRHGQIWLTNADGSKGRKQATFASGNVNFTGTSGTDLPAGSQMSGSAGGVIYQTTEDITIGAGPTEGPVVCLTAGTVGNQDDGAQLNMINPPFGVDDTATVVVLENGVDTETDPQLRSRVLLRIQQPPMGGATSDYILWAEAVPGVTRAWAAPEMGVGTMTVRFLMDDLRASDDGWPGSADCTTVQDYLDSKRPVTVKDMWALAPNKVWLDVQITDLNPNTPEAQAEIETSLTAMLQQQAAPGQTIFEAWISSAIMQAPHVISFDLVSPTTDLVMPDVGSMAVLRDITYV